MPLTNRARAALLALALPAALFASAAHAETLSCPALDKAVQVAACPSDAELQYTFLGFCGDNARLYGRDVLTCASFENYKAVKNTAYFVLLTVIPGTDLNCNLDTALLRGSRALKMRVEKKNGLTRLICDYENDQRMVMRSKGTCTVEAADCSGGECRARCE